MIIDLQTTFSGSTAADGTKTGQAITATAISANVLDLRNAATPTTQDEGLTFPESWLIVQATVAANGADSAKTLTITLESATDTGLSSGPVVHYSSGAILGSAITAGATLVRMQLPSADYKRYMGVRYTVSAAFTAFNVLAYLVNTLDRNVPMPVGYTVS